MLYLDGLITSTSKSTRLVISQYLSLPDLFPLFLFKSNHFSFLLCSHTFHHLEKTS